MKILIFIIEMVAFIFLPWVVGVWNPFNLNGFGGSWLTGVVTVFFSTLFLAIMSAMLFAVVKFCWEMAKLLTDIFGKEEDEH